MRPFLLEIAWDTAPLETGAGRTAMPVQLQRHKTDHGCCCCIHDMLDVAVALRKRRRRGCMPEGRSCWARGCHRRYSNWTKTQNIATTWSVAAAEYGSTEND